MDIPYCIFLSNQLKSCSKDSFCLYLLMRAEVTHGDSVVTKVGKSNNRLVCSLSVDMMAEKLSLPRITIERLLDEMSKREWVKLVGTEQYLLGEIKDYHPVWFLDFQTSIQPKISENDITKEESQRPSDIIKKKLAEDAEKIRLRKLNNTNGLTDVTKEKLARNITHSYTSNEIKAKDILMLFLSKYKEKFNRNCPLIQENANGNPYAETYVYINRAIKCSKNPRETYDCISFIFNNWDELKVAIGFDGPPTFNMLGSSKVWPRILAFRTEGIPKPKSNYKKDANSVTHRYEKSNEELLGW